MASSCKVFTPDRKLRLTSQDKPGDCFVLLFAKGKGLVLTLSTDRLLHDSNGCGFACEDETLMADTVDRPGVGVFSLPEDHWSNIAAAIHDYQTSCRAYMLAHGRSEAEADFRRHLQMVSTTFQRRVVSTILGAISNSLSWIFWDIPKTRWL